MASVSLSLSMFISLFLYIQCFIVFRNQCYVQRQPLRILRYGSEALKPTMALKDGAEKLLSSGKTLALAGESMIGEQTNRVTPWTNSGARIRNAGDSIAEAGAKARFKTGSESVSEALRTASEELEAAYKSLEDVSPSMSQELEKASLCLEKSGWAIAVSETKQEVGQGVKDAGEILSALQVDYQEADEQVSLLFQEAGNDLKLAGGSIQR